MRKALVDDGGYVRNVILLDEETWEAPRGLSIEDCAAMVGPGWRRAGDGFEVGAFEEGVA